MGKDYWWTAPAEADNGNTIIVTGHDNLDKYIDSGKYDSRVEIVWNYPALPSGMPEPDAEEIMEKVTEALQLPLKKERAIVMTGIYTGDGKREWIFYTKNLRIFSFYLNRALENIETLPLEIEAYADPEWEEYKQMREMTYIPDSDD